MKTIALAALALLGGMLGPSRTDLTLENFDSLLAQIQPTEEELSWQAVGWHPSLGAAVEEAQAKQKPILLWAMNGHPLGCV